MSEKWKWKWVGGSQKEKGRANEHTKRTFFIIMIQGHPACLDENVFFKKRKRRKENVFRENEKLCVENEKKLLEYWW